MNKTEKYLIIILLFFSCSSDKTCQENHKVEKITYFNQDNPGLIPEKFAPHVFSTGKEFGAIYSPDYKELYFSMLDSLNSKWQIMVMYHKDTNWTSPKVASFSGIYNEANPSFSSDGNKIFYCSGRPDTIEGIKKTNYDIWFVERSVNGWGSPINAGPVINSDYYEDYPCLTKNGSLYFISNRPGGKGSIDIYYTNFTNGKYSSAKNLGETINTEFIDYDPLIINENRLIFVSNRDNDFDTEDLYISDRKDDNSWTIPKKLSTNFNTSGFEYGPKISPDGKFFFFTSSSLTPNTRIIYWVDIKALDESLIKQ